jgi:steroid 5-alpha reductase family enzyme
MKHFYEALLISGLLTIAYQLCFFTIAAYFKFDKVTDLAGGTNFAVVTILIFGIFAASDPNGRQIALTCLVTIWAIRLSSFLFYRVVIFEKDSRFDGTRENFFAFLNFWIFQMIWVFIVTIPLMFVDTHKRNGSLNGGDYLGFTLASIGLICETWADQSKLFFKKDESTKGKWCDWGLWKYSRHPNYFGKYF